MYSLNGYATCLDLAKAATETKDLPRGVAGGRIALGARGLVLFREVVQRSGER